MFDHPQTIDSVYAHPTKDYKVIILWALGQGRHSAARDRGGLGWQLPRGKGSNPARISEFDVGI